MMCIRQRLQERNRQILKNVNINNKKATMKKKRKEEKKNDDNKEHIDKGKEEEE